MQIRFFIAAGLQIFSNSESVGKELVSSDGKVDPGLFFFPSCRKFLVYILNKSARAHDGYGDDWSGPTTFCVLQTNGMPDGCRRAPTAVPTRVPTGPDGCADGYGDERGAVGSDDCVLRTEC